MILFTNNQIPKLLCSTDLSDSVHWLRAAGYDVDMPSGPVSDLELFNIAQKSDRLLVISQSKVEKLNRDEHRFVSVESGMVYEQIKQISSSLSINWLHAPFSRCMVCNTKLVPLNINQWLKLPEHTASRMMTSHGCPACDRIYWPGEHVDKMVQQLELFNKASW